MGKHLSYNFHIWKNAYHRVFIQFSVRMELYDKKFLIYGNCMIRSFGQPGLLSNLIASEVRFFQRTLNDLLKFFVRNVHPIKSCLIEGSFQIILSIAVISFGSTT